MALPTRMARSREHLSRAPITEALIDLQFPAGEIKLKDLHKFSSLLDGYEAKGPIFQIETEWNISKEKGAKEQSKSLELGVRLHSTDDKYVLQIRTEAFTLSRLEPYETWENLSREARRLWHIFNSQIRPETIRRTATRFINRLRLPMKAGEQFQEYLTKPPDVPDGLPQGVAGFLQRVVLLNPNLNARANVIQVLQEGFAPADHVPVVLDIDVYSIGDFPPDADDVWNLLESLRVFKNEIFFASLTEKTISQYE